MLPQNVPPWHIDYFKLKEFKKNGRSWKVTLTTPSTLQKGHKTPRGEVPSAYQEKRNILLFKDKGTLHVRNQLVLIRKVRTGNTSPL